MKNKELQINKLPDLYLDDRKQLEIDFNKILDTVKNKIGLMNESIFHIILCGRYLFDQS